METVQTIQRELMIEGIRLGRKCSVDGKPATSRAIGEWLAVKYPDKYVRKIIERNPHIKQFSKRIKLTRDEGGRNVTRHIEVFDPIGLQLIILQSQKPKAFAFQMAIAHLANDIICGNIKPRKTRANKDSFIHYPEFQQVINYIKEHPGAGGKEIQAALGIPYSTSSINRWVRYIRGEQPPSPLC